MKLRDLKHGDKIICLRIDTSSLEFVYINLKVISVIDDYKLIVKSSFLEKYTIYGSLDKEVNGKQVVLDCGQPEELMIYIEEYLFETLEDCKEFAIEYCEKKIKNYEEIIQRAKAW